MPHVMFLLYDSCNLLNLQCFYVANDIMIYAYTVRRRMNYSPTYSRSWSNPPEYLQGLRRERSGLLRSLHSVRDGQHLNRPGGHRAALPQGTQGRRGSGGTAGKEDDCVRVLCSRVSSRSNRTTLCWMKEIWLQHYIRLQSLPNRRLFEYKTLISDDLTCYAVVTIGRVFRGHHRHAASGRDLVQGRLRGVRHAAVPVPGGRRPVHADLTGSETRGRGRHPGEGHEPSGRGVFPGCPRSPR